MTPSEAEMELREHHCLGDQTALLAGTDEDGVGEDPLNAWFPRGSIFEESNVSLLCSLLRISFCLRTISPLPCEKWRDGA